MPYLPTRRRRLVPLLLLAGSLSLTGAGSLLAQGVSPGGTGTGPAPADSAGPGAVEAGPDRVIITDVPLEQSVLPTVRPYTSAFGLEDNILDVPRNVTIISREQLDTINISSVRDFSKLTSSSFTTTNFGAPAVPSIRGFYADVFLNGQRRGLTSNGNGLPLDFNQVESVSIFKGPATVIYGPSQYVGGFVDLVTKRPYFDKFQGSVTGTVGMYDQNRYTLDFGGPIIANKLAYRISYSGEESGSFYENGGQSTQSVYSALTWMPTDKYKLEFNASYFQADYTENFGVNRPTQDLIDNGRYSTGAVIDQNGDGVRNSYDVNSSGNRILPSGTIDLNRSRRLLAPGDGSYGREIEAQAIQTLTLNDHLTLVNNLYGNYIKRDTRSSYYYSEVVDNAYVIDDRTELRGKYEGFLPNGAAPSPKDGGKTRDAKDAKAVADMNTPNGWKVIDQFNVGIDIRYQHVLAYDDYFNEPANSWDLSAPRSQIEYRYANSGLPIKGHEDRYAFPGGANGDTGDSNLVNGGVFVQNELKVGPLSLLTGARADILYVHYQDPIFFDGGTDTGDDTIAAQPNFNVSLSYQITPKITSYVTYNYSQSTGVGNGGGLVADSTGQFTSGYFHRISELIEGGFKFSLLKDTLFISTAGFYQTRNVPGLGGTTTPTNVTGYEFEMNYQPNKNFYLTAGYTLTEAFQENQIIGNAQGVPFDQLPVNADGTVTVDSFTGTPGSRQQGLPEHLINALATYKTDFGLGASLGLVVTSVIHNDVAGLLRIPWQYSFDATIFYNYKNVETRLAFLNLTDADNWAPPNYVYGDSSIMRELPFRIEGSVKIRF